MSPGRDCSDTDMEPTASQSADCEPTPPLQRHGSKSNFFLPPVENNESPRHPQPPQHRHPIHYPRGSPHPRPRYAFNLFLTPIAQTVSKISLLPLWIVKFLFIITSECNIVIDYSKKKHRSAVAHSKIIPGQLGSRKLNRSHCSRLFPVKCQNTIVMNENFIMNNSLLLFTKIWQPS